MFQPGAVGLGLTSGSGSTSTRITDLPWGDLSFYVLLWKPNELRKSKRLKGLRDHSMIEWPRTILASNGNIALLVTAGRSWRDRGVMWEIPSAALTLLLCRAMRHSSTWELPECHQLQATLDTQGRTAGLAQPGSNPAHCRAVSTPAGERNLCLCCN